MKQIPLTRGKFSIVDDDVFEFLSQWKWLCTTDGYAARQQHISYFNGKKKNKLIKMHNVIMNPPDGMEVDHRDPTNKLDNRRDNLRNCTGAQNRMNRRPFKGKVSEYKGVWWRKDRKRWVAEITIDGKKIQLGHFAREEDAAQAWNFAALEHHGEFARLNHAA